MSLGGEDTEDEGDVANEEEKDRVDNEYYSFLNLPRNAETAEVTAAYKRMSRLYHPDKHQDHDKKKQAEIMFAKLKKAHEVLNDPHKRAIYDCLGKKGLEEQGWQVVQRTKTPREIREEYEQIAREREERRLLQNTNPTSRLQMSVNATDIFERYTFDEAYDDVLDDGGGGGGFMPVLEVTEITFAQTIEAPISNRVNVVLSGNVTTRNGSGHGGVNCSMKRLTSDKCWQEVEVGVGNGPIMAAKFYRKLSKHAFINMSGSIQLSSKGLKPGLNISVGNRLSKHTIGYLTYNTNWIVESTDDSLSLSEDQSGMSTMLVKDTDAYHLMASVQLGIPYTYLILSATRKFTEPQTKIRSTVKLGTFGAIVEYGVERRITKHSTLGATMVVGVPVGVTLRIKLTRATQTYTFPIHLADEILLQPIFYGTVTPLIAWFTVKKLIVEPFEAQRKKKAKDRQRQADAAKVAEAKKEASAAVDLMTERFTRIRAAEQARNGLVVAVALYGKLLTETGDLVPGLSADLASCPSAGFDGDGPPSPFADVVVPDVIDVTVPVQCLVEDGGRISVYEGGTKTDLAGFYDPAPSDDDKHLLVRYVYGVERHTHQVVVADDEGLKVPKTSHRINAAASTPGSSSAAGTNGAAVAAENTGVS